MNHVFFECEAHLSDAEGRRLSESKRVGLSLHRDGNIDIDIPKLELEVSAEGVADRIVFQITPGTIFTILFAEITAPTATIGQTFTMTPPKC